MVCFLVLHMHGLLAITSCAWFACYYLTCRRPVPGLWRLHSWLVHALFMSSSCFHAIYAMPCTGGLSLGYVNLRGLTGGKAEMAALLAAAAAGSNGSNGSGGGEWVRSDWIIGTGWSESDWGGGWPDRTWIDEVRTCFACAMCVCVGGGGGALVGCWCRHVLFGRAILGLALAGGGGVHDPRGPLSEHG